MKVLVIGCSYSHGDSFVNPDQSYPALMAKNNKSLFVVNTAMPGSSNDSYYVRFKHAQEVYGKFDLILCQLTAQTRLTIPIDPDYIETLAQFYGCPGIDNYYFTKDQGPLNGEYIFVTDGVLITDNLADTLAKKLEVKKQTFQEMYMTLFSIHSYTTMLTLKEVQLLNNSTSTPIIYYAWDNYLNEQVIEEIQNHDKSTWIGTVKDWFSDEDNFKQYCADKWHHLNTVGHQKLYNVLVNDKIPELRKE